MTKQSGMKPPNLSLKRAASGRTLAAKPISAAMVKDAMRSFDAGMRPFRFTQPRAWYVVGPKGHVYPLKYLYAIAVNKAPRQIHTEDAKRELPKLGFEIKCEPKNTEIEFQRRVDSSQKDPLARAARLAKAPRLPRMRFREVVVFDRNPDVVAEVLARAKGRCETCGSRAPFRKRSDGSPYLEVHHIEQLAHGGDDMPANAIANCPNCHRKAHHG